MTQFKKITFLLISFLIYINSFSQVFISKNMDDKQIVSTFLETKWNEKDSTFKWIPNLSESIQFSNTIKKDTLITTIDTVFNYVESDIRKKIILFSTNTFSNNCHACQSALGIIELSFNELKDSMQVDNISKNFGHFGLWGESPKEKSLQQVQQEKICFKISEKATYFGIESEVTTIYCSTNKLLSFLSYKSNNDAVEFDHEKYSFKSKIIYDKKNDTLKVIKIGTEPNDRGKIIKVHNVTTYRYDEGYLIKVSSKNILNMNNKM